MGVLQSKRIKIPFVPEIAVVVVGTIHYMAPELLMGRRATPQSDLYALGTVLYEMLAGQQPFQGDSTATLMANILNNPLTPITLVNLDTPPEI